MYLVPTLYSNVGKTFLISSLVRIMIKCALYHTVQRRFSRVIVYFITVINLPFAIFLLWLSLSCVHVCVCVGRGGACVCLTT